MAPVGQARAAYADPAAISESISTVDDTSEISGLTATAEAADSNSAVAVEGGVAL